MIKHKKAMTEKTILLEVYQLPESLKLEVLHFISFLKKEYVKNNQENIDPSPRIFGRAKGKYKMSPDFDEPLDDFKDYM